MKNSTWLETFATQAQDDDDQPHPPADPGLPGDPGGGPRPARD